MWRTSTYSFSNGNCAEIAAWRKASASNSGGCVEAGDGETVVAVRDTKDRDGITLEFAPAAWREFTTRLTAN